MACKRMFASGRGTLSHARPSSCIGRTNHILAALMPPMHASTVCISIWSVPFPHYECTVSSSSVQVASDDGVLADSHTETVFVAFLQNWVARFGAPRSVKTNHGPRFEPTLLFRQCKCLGYERIRTTAHHPATNGMVKRHFRAHLKAR